MHLFRASVTRSLVMASLVFTFGTLLGACQPKSSQPSSSPQSQDAEINRLQTRVDQLERQVRTLSRGDDAGDRVPPGPIQSITFRSGTADDRVRIYWENGTVSDLPCTLEQGTWACG